MNLPFEQRLVSRHPGSRVRFVQCSGNFTRIYFNSSCLQVHRLQRPFFLSQNLVLSCQPFFMIARFIKDSNVGCFLSYKKCYSHRHSKLWTFPSCFPHRDSVYVYHFFLCYHRLITSNTIWPERRIVININMNYD